MKNLTSNSLSCFQGSNNFTFWYSTRSPLPFVPCLLTMPGQFSTFLFLITNWNNIWPDTKYSTKIVCGTYSSSRTRITFQMVQYWRLAKNRQTKPEFGWLMSKIIFLEHIFFFSKFFLYSLLHLNVQKCEKNFALL